MAYKRSLIYIFKVAETKKMLQKNSFEGRLTSAKRKSQTSNAFLYMIFSNERDKQKFILAPANIK